jgi:hypothetical protein
VWQEAQSEGFASGSRLGSCAETIALKMQHNNKILRLRNMLRTPALESINRRTQHLSSGGKREAFPPLAATACSKQDELL